MAPRGKFKLDRRTVRMIAREDRRLAAAVDEVAEDVARQAGPSATVDHYTTDRHVGGVVVPATDQARDGRLTRAAQRTAARNAALGIESVARPFTSRAAWRRAFANNEQGAARRAAVSASYAALPERARRRDG